MRELLRTRPRRRDGNRSALRRALRPGAEPLESRELLATDVLTYHNDNARTGQNLNETVLKSSTLNPSTFGKLFSYPVDGDIYAQPLYQANLLIRGTVRNVVFVATTRDSVYAFDADSNLGPNAAPLWHTNFTNPALGITTVPGSDLDTGNFTEVGIIGTPVIDKGTGTLYVSAMTKEATPRGPAIVHRLHALDVTTGAEKPGGPKIIQATVPGKATGGQTVTFEASKQLQRSALLLANGVVYVAFASFQNYPYHGWLMAYNASNLQQIAAFNVTPDSRQGSIWMSGGGPAADAAGNVFVATANGKFSADAGGRDYGDSVLRLTRSGGGLRVVDYYSPSNQESLDRKDQDLGSGGVVLLPQQAGGRVPLMVAADKNGTIYLLNRDDLGGHSPTSDDVVTKTRPGAIGILNGDTNLWLGAYDTPAYFNNALYYAAPGDRLKVFPVANGRMSRVPTRWSANTFAYPGGTPSISAYGTTGSIVWILENAKEGAILHAYDALNVSRELYSSEMAGYRDQLNKGVKFVPPTVADGKVFVATQGRLTVFGDFNAGYVAGQRSLFRQGFSQDQVYLMLAASPATSTVWHPATAALTNALDREAQMGLFPQKVRRARTPRPRGFPRGPRRFR